METVKYRKLRDSIKLRRQIKELKQRTAYFFRVNRHTKFLVADWPIEALKMGQPQRTMRSALIQIYVNRMKTGDLLPAPVTIKPDGTVGDGRYRIAACKQMGIDTVHVIIFRDN
jgi:hypothetical protein